MVIVTSDAIFVSVVSNLLGAAFCENFYFLVSSEMHPPGVLWLFMHVLPESGDFPDSGNIMQL